MREPKVKVERLSDVRRAVNEKKRAGETVQRREQERHPVISALRILTLICMIVLVGGGIFLLRDEINIYNIKRAFSFFSLSGYESKPFEEIKLSYDTALSPVFATEGNRMICATTDEIIIKDFEGEDIYTEKVMFIAPAVETDGKYSLIYDRGGREVRLFSNSTLVMKEALDSALTAARINKYGELIAVTGATGYKSKVTVYNENHDEIYRWRSAERYVSAVDLADSGKEFVAVSLSTDEGDIISRISFCDVTSEQPVAYVDLPGVLISDICYKKDGTVTAVGDSAVYAFSASGKLLNTFSFSGRVLQNFDASPDKATALVLNRHTFGSGTNLVLLDTNAKAICDLYVGSDVTELSAGNQRVLMLSGDEILVYSSLGEALGKVEAPRDTRKILQNSAVGAMAVMVDRVESVTIP